jgi:hypothetical protein
MGKADAAKRLEVPAWSVRLAAPEDSGFIYNSWITSAQRTYPNMYAQDFCNAERARVQRIMNESVSCVAHLEEELNELLGFVVYGRWRSMFVLHRAHVKPEARRHGVLTSMLEFANWQKLPVVLTSPAQDERVMQALTRRFLYDQAVLPLMQRGGR